MEKLIQGGSLYVYFFQELKVNHFGHKSHFFLQRKERADLKSILAKKNKKH